MALRRNEFAFYENDVNADGNESGSDGSDGRLTRENSDQARKNRHIFIPAMYGICM